jgi:opacity protein-like surface antigen
MGPLHSAAEVRAASQNFIPVSAGIVTASREKMYAPMALSHKRYALHALGRNNDMYSPFDRSFIPTEAGWYIAGSLGAQSSRVDSNLGVNNGSGYPAPFGTDSYSTSTKSAAIAGMEGGYRWVRNNQWLPAYTLGLRYKHLFSTNVGRQITQYSTPEFTNYNYNWNVSSDVLLIASKLNLVQFGQFLPYVTGGVGIAFNHAANYNETALAGVTPRTNPAFDNNTDREFTYMVGAGVDWQVSPRVILSLGYEFQDLGSLSSGKGTGLWAADALHTGSYRTNSVLFSTSYLIGK